MTANHEHMPPEDWLHTEWIRSAAITGKPIRGNTFDRWLAARDARIEAAAEQHGAEKSLRRAEKLLKEDRAELGETVSTQLMIDWLRLLAGQPINHKEEDDE